MSLQATFAGIGRRFDAQEAELKALRERVAALEGAILAQPVDIDSIGPGDVVGELPRNRGRRAA